MAKRDGTVDLRIKRTQKSIKNAFYELIEEKGFDHISVKDITERAMISRNTFYLHYNDKFDLLNKVCDELVFKLFIGVGKQLRRETRKLRVDIYGAAHRQSNKQEHIISPAFSSAGFFKTDIAKGEWKITLNVHSVSCDVDYKITVEGEEK